MAMVAEQLILKHISVMEQKKAHPEKDDNDGKPVQRDEDITKKLHTPNQLTG